MVEVYDLSGLSFSQLHLPGIRMLARVLQIGQVHYVVPPHGRELGSFAAAPHGRELPLPLRRTDANSGRLPLRRTDAHPGRLPLRRRTTAVRVLCANRSRSTAAS